MDDKPKVAYVVSDVDGDESEVIFATSRGKALARGRQELDFVDRRAKRAPELDQYLAKGGPTWIDLRKHGWWVTRQGTRCCRRVESEEGGIRDGKIYCDDCLAKVGEAQT